MITVKTKQEKGHDKTELRMKAITSRMVGMYRLMTEQAGEERVNTISDYVADHLMSTAKWRRFKTVVLKYLNQYITSFESMSEIADNATKDTGSLKDLLWENSQELPKQVISVRMGKVMEDAVSEFLATEFQDWNSKLDAPVEEFADYKIQRDIAVSKDKVLTIAELKYNFNLDTEKSRAVVDKLDLLNVFSKVYVKDNKLDMKPNVCLVSLRYADVSDIPKLKGVLESVRSQYIVGYKQFFKYFDMHVTETMWKNLHKKLGEEVIRRFEIFKRSI